MPLCFLSLALPSSYTGGRGDFLSPHTPSTPSHERIPNCLPSLLPLVLPFFILRGNRKHTHSGKLWRLTVYPKSPPPPSPPCRHPDHRLAHSLKKVMTGLGKLVQECGAEQWRYLSGERVCGGGRRGMRTKRRRRIRGKNRRGSRVCEVQGRF